MIRVMTANLYNGAADPDRLAGIIDTVSPDVLATQELAPNAAAVIGPRFPYGLVDPGTDCQGMGLVSRLPMVVRRQDLPGRDALWGEVEGPVPMRIWCVHLINPLGPPSAGWARRSQVRALRRHLDGNSPTLVVGDLNATPLWPAYRRLTSDLIDGVAAWGRRTGRRPEATWRYKLWLPYLLRIDHALVSSLTVAAVRTVTVPGSDHRGLVVDVEGA